MGNWLPCAVGSKCQCFRELTYVSTRLLSIVTEKELDLKFWMSLNVESLKTFRKYNHATARWRTTNVDDPRSSLSPSSSSPKQEAVREVSRIICTRACWSTGPHLCAASVDPDCFSNRLQVFMKSLLLKLYPLVCRILCIECLAAILFMLHWWFGFIVLFHH